jgi:hypothetical protein
MNSPALGRACAENVRRAGRGGKLKKTGGWGGGTCARLLPVCAAGAARWRGQNFPVLSGAEVHTMGWQLHGTQ